MGLPTTANYIVVSRPLAPVIVTLGQQNGLIVPLIAVHLFVFYFGIMADVTPPVGLASFAAAAVSKGDPIKTGITAFYYSLHRGAAVPVHLQHRSAAHQRGLRAHGVLIFIVATIAMLIFAAATQGFFLVKSRWYESVLLLLVAFTLFPSWLLDGSAARPVSRHRPGRAGPDHRAGGGRAPCACAWKGKMGGPSCAISPCCCRCLRASVVRTVWPSWDPDL